MRSTFVAGCSGFLCAVLVAAAFGNAAAAESPFSIYAKIPPKMLDKAFTLGHHPDDKGLSSHNAIEHKWLEVGQQLDGVNPLVIAAVRGDRALAEQQWTAVDAAFSHQRPDGTFEQAAEIDGKKTNPTQWPTTTSFFVAGLAHAIFVMQNSPLEPAFRTRIAMVRERLKPTMRWLSQQQNVDIMMHVDHATTNRIFMDAEALILGGLLAENGDAVSQGQRMLASGLARQTPEGIFPEGKGGDSSYQACSLYVLDEIAAVTDRDAIMPGLRRGMAWELSRINSDGTINLTGNTRTGLGQETYFGHPKGENYAEIVRALAVYAALTGDAAAMQKAAAVLAANP